MKRLICMLSAMSALLATNGAEPNAKIQPVPECIGFYGNITTPSTGQATAYSMALVFRLYDSAKPNVALWGRRISVKVNPDGDFYVELSDDVGASVMGGVVSTLGAAMGMVRGTPEIGITPPGADEFKPRFTLSTASRAERAAVARTADKVVVSESVNVGTVQASRVKVTGNLETDSLTVGSGKIALTSSDASIGVADSATTYLIGGIRGVCWNFADESSVAGEESTPCDRLEFFRTDNGQCFAFPVPKGSVINPSTTTLRIGQQVFGR